MASFMVKLLTVISMGEHGSVNPMTSYWEFQIIQGKFNCSVIWREIGQWSDTLLVIYHT